MTKHEAQTFDVVILRQDGPGKPSYWERFRVEREPDMNVISVLQKIAAAGCTAEGNPVAPWPGSAIAWRRSAGPAPR
jgi:succinate dehydrogenase / fumarate reductase, iron-sulfur subunit